MKKKENIKKQVIIALFALIVGVVIGMLINNLTTTGKADEVIIWGESNNVNCISGGEGTASDPIVICTPQDLDHIRNNLDAYYVIGQDIDLGVFPYNAHNGWEPIGGIEFLLVLRKLDGDGHKIKFIYK